MTTDLQKWHHDQRERRINFVFDTVMALPFGEVITTCDLDELLVGAGLTRRGNASRVMREVRAVLGDDVIVSAYDPVRKVRGFRRAKDLEDAELWRHGRASAIRGQIRNLLFYTEAEARRFKGEVKGAAWDMAHESMRRAADDIDRAATMVVGRT